MVELPAWVYPADLQKASHSHWKVEESRYSLQSAERGVGRLLLNSWTPTGVRGESFYRLQLGLRGVCSAHVHTPGWSVVCQSYFAL